MMSNPYGYALMEKHGNLKTTGFMEETSLPGRSFTFPAVYLQ